MLETFFRDYERNSNDSAFGLLLAQFADVFLAANPAGASAVQAAAFAAALPIRKKLFEALGCVKTTLVSLEETPLDAQHSLARTQWRMRFTASGQAPVDIIVDSTFIVRLCPEPKIVFYLTHQDIMAALSEHGITAANVESSQRID